MAKLPFTYKFFHIKNSENAKFLIPDTNLNKMNCDKINEDSIRLKYQFSESDKFNFLEEEKTRCLQKNYTCPDFDMRDNSEVFNLPLYSMQDWHLFYPNIYIKINTLPFATLGDTDRWTKTMPCTKTRLQSRSSSGVFLLDGTDKYPADYLFIKTKNKSQSYLEFFLNKEINQEFIEKKDPFTRGVLLIHNGKYVENHDIFVDKTSSLQETYKCFDEKGRLLLGTFSSGIFILLVSPKGEDGATCSDLIDFLIKKEVQEAMLFDGGYSAQIYTASDGYVKISNYSSRPIPQFLGITPNNPEDFYLVEEN